MGDARHAAIHISHGKQGQDVGPELFDEFAIARSQFTRVVRSQHDGVPGARDRIRRRRVVRRGVFRGHQRIKNEIGSGKFVGSAEAGCACAGPCIGVRASAGGDEKQLQLIREAVARIDRCKSHVGEGIAVFPPDPRFIGGARRRESRSRVGPRPCGAAAQTDQKRSATSN